MALALGKPPFKEKNVGRIVGIACLLVGITGGARADGPPCPTLLPPTTKLWISIPQPAEFEKAWAQTQLYQLLIDPKLQPFLEQLDPLGRRWLNTSLSWTDLRNTAGGEMCWSLTPTTPKTLGQILLLDVTNKKDAAAALLRKAAAHLKKDGYSQEEKSLGKFAFTVFTRGEKGDPDQPTTVVLCQFGDHLAITDQEALLGTVLDRRADPNLDSLAQTKPFKEVLARTAAKEPPHLRWFLDPLGYAEAQKAARAKPPMRGPDLLKILRSEGFSAFQGMGGVATFAAGGYEILHRTAVYIPPPYEKSMQAVRITVPGDRFTIPAWAGKDVGLAGTMHLDLNAGYPHIHSLFDAFFFSGERGTFNEIVKDLRDDPCGPRVDVPKDVIGRLGKRVTWLADVETPNGPAANRMLFAVETSDEKALAQALRKMMENDPEVKSRIVNDVVIWESTPRERKKKDAKAAKPPTQALAVAHGHLLLASHTQFLQKVLKAPDQGFADTAEYRLVMKELDKIGGDAVWLRLAARPDINLQTVYEQVRRKELDQSSSIVGRGLQMLLGDRLHKIDTAKLVDFDHVRQYLGPTGLLATHQSDGWFFTGILLKKAK